ncbi:MAG: malate dehydrogenase [Candidatus Omnitrophica bacterium]|nr:malate dehydrogenase [Candidatus Omnitrophota bacterium]MBU1905947.1 malate dehydrogenase [Candidatus Omnitrophota bacterium]
MKISIIGAGNVGSTTAMRLAQEGLGEIILVDVVKGLAQGKAFDLEDARSTLKIPYNIQGSDDINSIKISDIVVITAGLPRKPGMTREDLVSKNALILKDVCENIKKLAPESIIIVVTNPLDLMTYFALTLTGFKSGKVIGMGASLDAARFANLISKELNIPFSDIETSVIGSHGQGMIPLTRFTTIKGVSLEEYSDDKKTHALVDKTIGRGAEIVSLLGSGSAYFAPSAAITALVKCIVKNEKRTIGVCTYLDGEYGINDLCIGVPCRIGREGIEKIIELELNKTELETLKKSAEAVRKSIELLPL